MLAWIAASTCWASIIDFCTSWFYLFKHSLQFWQMGLRGFCDLIDWKMILSITKEWNICFLRKFSSEDITLAAVEEDWCIWWIEEILVNISKYFVGPTHNITLSIWIAEGELKQRESRRKLMHRFRVISQVFHSLSSGEFHHQLLMEVLEGNLYHHVKCNVVEYHFQHLSVGILGSLMWFGRWIV